MQEKILLKEAWAAERKQATFEKSERLRHREIERQRKLWFMKQELKAYETRQVEEFAARKLQATGRGFLSRCEYRKVQNEQTRIHSSIRIQSYHRGRSSRKRVDGILKKKEQRKKVNTTVFCMYRMVINSLF